MTTQSVLQFFERFPTDDACLDHLWTVRYGDQTWEEMMHGFYATIPVQKRQRANQ